MKKRLTGVICLVLILFLTACASSQGGTLSGDPNPTAPTQGAVPNIPDPTEAPTDPTDPTEVPTDPTEPLPTEGAKEWDKDAALTRFLTDVNLNGELLYVGNDSAGGSMDPPAAIPQPDQSLIGEVVPIILAKEQKLIRFYYAYDQATGQERLAVIVPEYKFPLLMVFQTQLQGLDGLIRVIENEEVFEAKILVMCNIAFEEGYIYAFNVVSYSEDLSQQEHVPISGATPAPEAGEYIGLVGIHDNDQPYCKVLGAKKGTASDALQDKIKIFFRIFERFDLLDVVAVS